MVAGDMRHHVFDTSRGRRVDDTASHDTLLARRHSSVIPPGGSQGAEYALHQNRHRISGLSRSVAVGEALRHKAAAVGSRHLAISQHNLDPFATSAYAVVLAYLRERRTRARSLTPWSRKGIAS